MLYDQAKASYRQGQTNSILLITAGPAHRPVAGRSGLQQYIRGAFDQGRPIAVNVIDFGNDSDRATWEAVAQASGGSYQNRGQLGRVPTSTLRDHRSSSASAAAQWATASRLSAARVNTSGHLHLRVVTDPR